MAKTIIPARRHYPNIFTLEGKLDEPEVDNTIRNQWLSIYTLQQDVIDTKHFLEDAIDRGEISADDTPRATEIVRQTVIQTVSGSPAAGVSLVSPQSGRLPFINTALQLDGGNNAPEYDPSSGALTIRGAFIGALGATDTVRFGVAGTDFFWDHGTIISGSSSIWLNQPTPTASNFAFRGQGTTLLRINADTKVQFMTDDSVEYASYSSVDLTWRFRRHVLFDGQSDIIISTFRGAPTQTNPIILVQNDALGTLFTIDNDGNTDIQGTLDVVGAVNLSGAIDVALTATAFSQVTHSGAFTSDGGSDIAQGTLFDTDLTGAAGDGFHSQVRMGGSIVTEGSGNSVFCSTLHLREPDITLSGTDTMAIAATLYIVGAPTEGTSVNLAIFVDNGDCRFDGRVDCRENVVVVDPLRSLTVGSASPATFTPFSITGNFVSSGSSNHAERMSVAGQITGFNADTLSLAGYRGVATIVTQNGPNTIEDVAQMILVEPDITVSGSDVVTHASTLSIVDAPTEGVHNFALLVKSGESSFGGDLSVHNVTEGRTARTTRHTAHETHTLSLATSSVTTTLAIPAGARLLGASFNVNTAVTDDAGDDTWRADFSGGSTTALAALGTAPAVDTKVDTLIVDEITTATTEITFLPQGGSFSAGVIEIVVYYETLTSLANV